MKGIAHGFAHCLQAICQDFWMFESCRWQSTPRLELVFWPSRHGVTLSLPILSQRDIYFSQAEPALRACWRGAGHNRTCVRSLPRREGALWALLKSHANLAMHTVTNQTFHTCKVQSCILHESMFGQHRRPTSFTFQDST